MFKSSFSKYLTALVVIILVGFLMLSGIIISIIRTHTNEDKEQKLELASALVSDHFENAGVENLEAYLSTDIGASAVTLFPLLNLDYDFNILITSTDGKVLLSTFDRTEDNLPEIGGDLGVLKIDKSFETETKDDGTSYLVRMGPLPGITDQNSLIYGTPVMTKGVNRGYVFALTSLATEDTLIRITRQAVINGSIWVMMAALVAAYFITDRIVHPLKSMTIASKKFAKGDFTERIVVNGSDEVAELAIAFNNMAESLDNLEKMRNTFLASISHDLRTPMTTISGFIDGITSGAIPPEKHNHYLGVIQSEVHRLSRLVSQLLDVSRLDSGDRKFTPESFNIAELTRLLLVSLEQKINAKHLDTEFISDEDDVYAYADKDAIHQVLYNLCHNALKFSNDGGRFIIKISKKSDKKIIVSVYDDGQKMSEEDAQRIFDRFYKTDKSRGLDKDGVGLGLYICKTIIEAHNEEIGVKVLDDGCEFWFTVAVGEPVRRNSSELII
ncbi:MAG: HAMP domain-containing protein [Clostridia bacterium]|nr:HAMP domain-containing protein [Clostridia bacterium]